MNFTVPKNTQSNTYKTQKLLFPQLETSELNFSKSIIFSSEKRLIVPKKELQSRPRFFQDKNIYETEGGIFD